MEHNYASNNMNTDNNVIIIRNEFDNNVKFVISYVFHMSVVHMLFPLSLVSRNLVFRSTGSLLLLTLSHDMAEYFKNI